MITSTSNSVTARLTSKGQVTIPKQMRERLGVKPGGEIDFVEQDGAIVVRKHFDAEAFEAALDKWSGTIDLGGMTVDEYIDDMRGH